MTISLHVSGAGVAGDSQKLLVGVISDGRKLYEMFDSMALFPMWAIRRARKRLLNQVELTCGVRPEVV